MPTRAMTVEPGLEQGSCPYCEMVVDIPFGGEAADRVGECPECGGPVVSPATAHPAWFRPTELAALDRAARVAIERGAECWSCTKRGRHRPATTQTHNISFRGYPLCSGCARAYDEEMQDLVWWP